MRFAYTRPSPRATRGSGTGTRASRAIVWRRFDRARSRAELESLLAAADARRLHRPHDLLGPPGHRSAAASTTTSPRARRPDRARSSRPCSPGPGGSPSATRRGAADPPHHEWLVEHRDLEGDGLLWIVQPDESGLDASPKFDPVWGRRAHPRLGFPVPDPPQPAPPLGRPARSGTRAGRCSARSRRMSSGGSPGWRPASLRITPALVDRLWDERARALPRRGASPAADAPAVETWAALAPLALPDLPEAIGRRLVEQHLLDPNRFWLPVPPPSVSAAEPTFEPGPHARALPRATGAARPGSTRPGCSGSGCAGLATRSLPSGWPTH